MQKHQSHDALATRAVIGSLIEQVRLHGPAWLGVVRDKEGVARTLARVEARLRLLAEDDDGAALLADLHNGDLDKDRVKTVTMMAEDLREHIALSEQALHGTRDTLKRLREKKERMIATALDPAKKAAWIERVEAGLIKSEQASLSDLEKYNEWLAIAPVVLTRG